MIMRYQRFVLRSALVLSLLTAGSFGASGAALGDDAPPPATAPGDEAPRDRHHNPAWQACKKQADDQKLARGDARRSFMRSCMKSAKEAPPAPPA